MAQTPRSSNSSTGGNHAQIVFPVKFKVGGKRKKIDCFKTKKGTCSICITAKSTLVTISPSCTHQAKYCLECITRDIISNITQKGVSQFNCCSPGCKVVYEPHSVYPLLDQRNLGILDKLLLNKALENNHEFRWCKSESGCGYGQCVGNWQDLRGYYCCESCGEQHCFQHEILWHSGFNCDEYEEHVKSNPDIADDAVLGSFTKKCPNCGVKIAKLEGCDVMTCCQYGTHGCSSNTRKFKECDHGGKAFCGSMFCWRCLGKIKVGKRGGNMRNCKKNCPYNSLN